MRETMVAPRRGTADPEHHQTHPAESRLPVPAQSATKKKDGLWVRWVQGLEKGRNLSRKTLLFSDFLLP